VSTPVFFPLIPNSKRPAVRGWSAPDFQSHTPVRGQWYGLRADGLVIVDCDSQEAANAWLDEFPATYAVKTPRGYHFYYEWTEGSPTGPAVGVRPGVDIRAGSGSYVVCQHAPGYEHVHSPGIQPFDPAWIPAKEKVEVPESETWETIPAGQRNDTLAALGGVLRKKGMNGPTIAKTLVAMNGAYCDPPLDRDEVIAIAKSVGRYEPEPGGTEEVVWVESSPIEVQWANRMTLPPPPEWWWRPYFPKGKLVFMDGREGIGKGMFCTFLAMSAMSGVTPDGHPSEPTNVLWLPTEDDPEEDILRRLYASGYEPGKGHDIGFINERLKLPEHEDLLVDQIHESGAGLVILDPGRSYLGAEKGETLRDFSFNNEAHIRPGMESLIRVAKRTGATVVFVHHWNKNTGGDIFYRQSGSGGFNQVIRHRVTIARVERDGDNDGAFGVTKSNISDPGHVHGFTLEAVPEWETARFVLRAPMPEWTSLDEWHKAALEQRADEVEFVPVDLLHNELAFTLAKGAILPGRRELMAATGLSQRKVTDGLKVLREEGLIEGEAGKAQVWRG